ncbi:unnamed protein product [Trichobilharzia regenti]|nr:unnamed protein product [Trichobilharzia regenti]
MTYDVVKPMSSGKCLQKRKREATVIGVSQASPIYSTESLLMITNPNDAVSISTPIYEHEIDKNSCGSRRRRSLDELNTTVNISNNNNSTNGNTSYTGGGISGFLAKAVRSVYSHLMSSSLAVSQTSILSPPEDNSALIAGKHQHINTVDTSKVNSINDTSPLEVEKGNEEEELAVKNAVNTTHNLIKDEGGVAVVFDDDENDKHSVEIRKERENQSRSIKSFTSTSLPHTQSMSYEQQLQQHQQKYEDVVSIEDEVWKTVSSVHDDNGDVDVDADAGGNGNIDNSGDNKSSRTYSMEISNYESSEIDNILEGENKENMKVSQVGRLNNNNYYYYYYYSFEFQLE